MALINIKHLYDVQILRPPPPPPAPRHKASHFVNPSPPPRSERSLGRYSQNKFFVQFETAFPYVKLGTINKNEFSF